MLKKKKKQNDKTPLPFPTQKTKQNIKKPNWNRKAKTHDKGVGSFSTEKHAKLHTAIFTMSFKVLNIMPS